MTRPKPSDMATSNEFDRKCRELSDRIRRRVEQTKPTEADLARAGTNSEALRKMIADGNVKMFVRLGELAHVLETSPNWLLNLAEGDDREAVKGLLEAMAQSLGLPLEQAQPLVETAIRVLDSPAIPKSRIPLRDSARTLGLDIIQRFLNEGHR